MCDQIILVESLFDWVKHYISNVSYRKGLLNRIWIALLNEYFSLKQPVQKCQYDTFLHLICVLISMQR